MPLELKDRTQAVLKVLDNQAAARNLDLADYLQLYADAGAIALDTTASLREFDFLLDEFSEGLSLVPPLPSDFSRDDIYDGHN
jgi:hypothetical protein